MLPILLPIFSIGDGVNIVCMLNPETPSIYVDACQLRLSEHEVIEENQIRAQGKLSF